MASLGSNVGKVAGYKLTVFKTVNAHAVTHDLHKGEIPSELSVFLVKLGQIQPLALFNSSMVAGAAATAKAILRQMQKVPFATSQGRRATRIRLTAS